MAIKDLRCQALAMIQQPVQILWNEAVGADCFHLGLSCASGYERARPGQFVMLGLGSRHAPLLRRPFSIHRRIAGNGSPAGIELLYKQVGAGTRILARCRPGDTLDLLGPLGRGFRIPAGCRRVFLAAGGIGVAPLVFLADSLAEAGVDRAASTVFLGGRSKSDILCVDVFRQMGYAVVTTTDDGSLGNQCLVTHPLEAAARTRRPQVIYACGPMAMLACVAGISEALRLPCQVSIETVMACGMGACLGCAVAGAQSGAGYRHACRDGPVFEASELRWEAASAT
jgi:dihydroorotate dehydrogenase electron transfer subunit